MFESVKIRKRGNPTDCEAIAGIQQKNPDVEREFYLSCRNYFNQKRFGVFDYKEGAQEIEDLFHETFLKLWQEIETYRIYVDDNAVWRRDRNGNNRKMTASLNTYLMSIARNLSFEHMREEEIYESADDNMFDIAPEEQDEKNPEWIVERSVNSLPKRCREILTMFYYEGRSLDEILQLRQENQSKDGLKTGKSKCMKILKEKIAVSLKKYEL